MFNHLNSNLVKEYQGVFDGPTSELVGLVDDAYEKAINSGIGGILDSSGYLTREIPMGKVIGWEGGSIDTGASLSSLRLVTFEKNGVTRVISAYPIR